MSKKKKQGKAPKEIRFAGHVIDIDKAGNLSVRRGETIDFRQPGDYGADPIGSGLFRMVPSGDVVDSDERNRRLEKTKKPSMTGFRL